MNVLHRQELSRLMHQQSRREKTHSHLWFSWVRENAPPPSRGNSSPAKEKANRFLFVRISYAVKMLCVFSPLEKVSANRVPRTERKGWWRLLCSSAKQYPSCQSEGSGGGINKPVAARDLPVHKWVCGACELDELERPCSPGGLLPCSQTKEQIETTWGSETIAIVIFPGC